MYALEGEREERKEKEEGAREKSGKGQREREGGGVKRGRERWWGADNV